MATDGLSLVGFMEQQQAINYLRGACVVADDSDVALTQEWNLAKTQICPPAANAGRPQIGDLPHQHQSYVDQLKQQPWLVASTNNQSLNWQCKMVEIAPLLAFQFNVDSTRSAHHCQAISASSGIDELLLICLPQSLPNESAKVDLGANSVIFRAKCLNLRTQAAGKFGDFMGVHVSLSVPLAHVVRHNGLCYLHNGFHRAYGLMKSGVTHMPCIFRDVASHDEVGIRSDGNTFSAQLLESTNPPTVGHFGQCAYKVSMRSFSRIIHVSWSEYTVLDD